MIGTPIAFGLTMVVCFTLFYYYWRIRQLRARLLSVQTTPPAHDVDFQNVVETFPTIKAYELKCTASEDLQCPICLVDYEEWEVLRQLPFCGHIFHTVCVGAWFDKQTTCPVCRTSMSELTEPFGGVEEVVYRGPRSSDSTVVEVLSEASSCIRINRLLPLPAPPNPESATAPESAACANSCPQLQGHGTETTTRTTKTSSSQPGDAFGSSDFCVGNTQQQVHQEACSESKSTAKSVKAVTSDHSHVQILIFQSRGLACVHVESSIPEGVSCEPEEASGSVDLVVAQPNVLQKNELGARSSGCDSSGSSNSGEPAGQAPENVLVSPQGSLGFQPILDGSGEMTSRATIGTTTV